MEETSNPTSQEATRAVLGPLMWMECLRLVVAPRIAETVKANPEVENRMQLHRAFCELHGVRPSYSTFSGWCEDLGISFKRRIEVNIPGWREMPRPSPEFIGPMPAVPTSQPAVQEEPVDPSAPVEWDTPRALDPVVLDNMPDILPGGMRPPAFFGGSDFAN